MADACHAGDLSFGLYYSTRDWFHPHYLVGDNSQYNEFLLGQIRELLTNYGQVDILWFDHVGGSWKDWRFRELYAMIKQLQPEILINNRGAAFVHRPPDAPSPELAQIVRGDFDTPEERLGHFDTDRAWESCITLAGSQWSYRPGGEMRSLKQCVDILVQCVTGDGNLLLNVGPMPDGRIEPRQAERLREIGQWLDKNGETIYRTRGGPWRNGTWGGSAFRDRTVYLHILQWENEHLTLPPIPATIVASTRPDGGAVSIQQTDQGVTVTLPAEQRDPLDTIVRLQLDAPAASIPPR